MMNSKIVFFVFSLMAFTYRLSAKTVFWENAETASLENDSLKIVFAKPGYSLRGISSQQGKNFIVEPKQGGDVFRLSLWQPDHPTEEILNHPRFGLSKNEEYSVRPSQAQSVACRVDELPDGKALRIKYRGLQVKEGKGPVDVTVSIMLMDDAILSQWSLEMDNQSGLELYDARFPVLSGVGGSTGRDYVVSPIESGFIQRNPATNFNNIGFYPNCMSMQVMGYYNGNGEVLYYGCHDGDFNRKEFQGSHTGKSFNVWISFAADSPAKGLWRLPFNASVGVLNGDWYDVAKTYRREFIGKRFKTMVERGCDSWFVNNNVWVQGGAVHLGKMIYTNKGDMDRLKEDLLRFRAALGEDFGFHWYVWHKHVTFDQFYPDYLPAQPEFKDTAAALEKGGIHCMPYINSHFFDTLLPEWSQGTIAKERVLDVKADRFDHKLYTMRTMCMGSKIWQDRIIGIERDILKGYPVSALYLDEIGSLPELCFDRKHGHEGHGGKFYAEGQNRIMSQIRSSADAWQERKPVIVGECLHDAHFEQLDGLLTGHMDLRPDSVPFFQAACSGYAQEMGIYLYPSELNVDTFWAKLGFSLVRGRQLGWFNTLYMEGKLDLTTPEHAPFMTALKEMCAVRTAGRDFLAKGELLRPPTLENIPVVNVNWRFWNGPIDNMKPQMRSVPAVFAETWRSADGRIAVFLVNHSGENRKVTFPWNRLAWGEVPASRLRGKCFSKNAWGKEQTFGSERIQCTLDAHSAAMLSFQ